MIRSAPFSGDSSDSSDDEHGTPKKSPQHRLGSKMSKLNALLGSKSVKNNATSETEAKKDTSDKAEPDYAVPPDAVGPSDGSSDEKPSTKHATVSQKTSLDSSVSESSSSTAQSNASKSQSKKSGWLTKLGGRVKTWKKRWFVLNEKDFELVYYKSVNDSSRKPRGQIALDASCKITSWDQSATFELMTSKRTFYLTAESQEERKSWINAIQTVLKRFKSPSTIAERSKFIFMQGWVSRVSNDKKFRCWCILSGSKLHFFRDAKGKAPFESIDMEAAKVEKITEWDEERLGKANGADCEKTVIITSSGKPPKTIIMLFNSKEGKENWFIQLKLASGESGTPGEVETEFERLSSKIVNDSGAKGVLWKNPVLCANKGSLEKPLTSLPTDALREEAMKLAKTCSLFISVPKDKPAIDYHVTLVQNALQSCLSHPVLRNEIYCQLIKQTNPGQIDPGEHSIKQAWQLLCVTVSSFLPQQIFYELFRMHLERCSTPKTEVGRYAIYCQRMIQRVKENGIRETHPSNLEILSIIQRHPYQHILPLSIPVHLKNDSYQVVSFDGSSTVGEFLKTLNEELGLRDCSESGFSLYTDDPCGGNLLHCLPTNLKICDVISKWEQTAKESRSAKKEVNRMMRLTYCNRLYFPNNVAGETDKERQLLAYQTMEDIIEGRFPVNKELALELTALMAQSEYGDYQPVSNKSRQTGRTPTLKLVAERFYPKRYRPTADAQWGSLCDKLEEKWSALKHKASVECIKIFMNVCRRWQFFGAKLFSAKYKTEEATKVWLAVQDSGISFLDYKSLHVLQRVAFMSLVTFGGIKDDLMFVVRKHSDREEDMKSEKIILMMTKPKILEVTGLIASYMHYESSDKHQSNKTASKGSHTMPKILPPKTLKLKQVSTVDRKQTSHLTSPMM
ncbi:Pleckstrin-likey domain-containing family H member 2 [Holothuria leucospilota]|uniref:Pleckstrin-likey domain-containing family H member 2 n=1 Tax=Holothuria leucospilota TaxID=206669 RepID=A0A9Q1CJ50_HOLLE|nr:Pleckstrin-likey domain-containing family H member 2 [Holothuria leucospilota]